MGHRFLKSLSLFLPSYSSNNLPDATTRAASEMSLPEYEEAAANEEEEEAKAAEAVRMASAESDANEEVGSVASTMMLDGKLLDAAAAATAAPPQTITAAAAIAAGVDIIKGIIKWERNRARGRKEGEGNEMGRA